MCILSYSHFSCSSVTLQALRLVLHTLATSAARYGRYIQPLLSLSIDFYVRLFVRVHTAPIDVKRVFRYVTDFVFMAMAPAKTNITARRLSTMYAADASRSTNSHLDAWSSK